MRKDEKIKKEERRQKNGRKKKGTKGKECPKGYHPRWAQKLIFHIRTVKLFYRQLFRHRGGAARGFLSSLGHRNGSSGTPWSTSSTSSVVRPWCRFSTLLCCRWWNSCPTCSGSSTGSRLSPSRSSKCRRFFLRTSLFARFLRDPQPAEQLVEVPTIVSYSWLPLRMEQNVDILVPGRGGRTSGLQGFPPGQSPTALHSPKERISERIVEQIVDIPGGGLQYFRPGHNSSSSSHVPARAYEGLAW